MKDAEDAVIVDASISKCLCCKTIVASRTGCIDTLSMLIVVISLLCLTWNAKRETRKNVISFNTLKWFKTQRKIELKHLSTTTTGYSHYNPGYGISAGMVKVGRTGARTILPDSLAGVA